MTDFPAIVPNEIQFDLGQHNISEVSTFAGPLRFRHSPRVNRHTLQLTYRGLSQQDVGRIRQHYIDTLGTQLQFELPTSLWGGISPVNSASVYRYASPPQEQHTGFHYDVTISLRITDGITLLYILDCGGAVQPSPTTFQAGVFVGTAPFILDCNGANPAATLVLNGGGATQ
jgi:hypothetical protein